MVRALALAIATTCALSCNAITGTNDLQAVDCLGDCRAAPGPFCGLGLQCGDGERCCVAGNCLDSKCTCSGDAACASPTVALACDGPEDCPSTARSCCVKLVLQAPTCTITIDPVGASCSPSTCSDLVTTSCNGSPTVRLCHKTSDCDGDDRCCAVGSSTGIVPGAAAADDLHVCATPSFALDPKNKCYP